MKKILSLLLCLGTIFSTMSGLCLPVLAQGEVIAETELTNYTAEMTQFFSMNGMQYRITYHDYTSAGYSPSVDKFGFTIGYANEATAGALALKFDNGDGTVYYFPLYIDTSVTQPATNFNFQTVTNFYSDEITPGNPVISIVPFYSIGATVDPSTAGTATVTGIVARENYYQKDTSVTLKASPNTGYEFSGWYENGILVSNSNPYEFKADTNHSFTARFAVQQLHITKDNTVVGGKYTVDPSIVNYNGSVMLTAVPNTGYSFTAWEYSADDGNSYTRFGNISLKETTFRNITSDLIIRPVFTGIPFTVTFNANKGTGTQMATQDFTYNSGAFLQKCTYTRTGYTFSGWNTEADGSGTPLKDETNGSLLSAAETNVTLYAQWTPIRYTITYDLDGGTIPQGEANPTEYKVNTPDFTIYNPVREGYEFLGWAGTGIQGRIIELLIKMGSTDNREYKADWEAKTYGIEFKPGSHGSINGSGGSPLSSYSVSSKYDTDFPVFNTGTSLDGRTLTAEAGYTFAGWKDENGNAPGAKVTGNASYTAQWTANTKTAYTVQFLKSDYDVLRSESKTGTTDAVVDISALVNEFPIPGYHYINEADYYIHSDITTLKPAGQNGVQIVGDGSLVIRLYYAENDRTHLTITVNNTKRGHLENFPNGMFLPPATGKAENVSVNVVSGCTFEKWVYTDAAHSTPTDVPNATGSTLTAAQIDSVAKDTGIYEPITFTAIITEPTATYNYSVSSASGGTVTKDTETIDAVTGEAAGSTAVPATGYDFEKWIYATDGTTASTSAAFVPGKVNGAYAGANYEAVFKKQTFAVNASVTPLETGTVTGIGTVEYGTGTTLTATPAAGYHFSGWSLNGSSVGTDAILPISNIKEIRNYTAQFEGNNYTVKFDSNGGSGTTDDETFTYGTSKNLIANGFERTGYTFSGWNTRNNGAGVNYSDAADIAKINLETVTSDNTITLYAQWAVVPYTISYELDGGTNNASNPKNYNITTETISLGEPTRTGYTFAGWTGSNGTTPQTEVTIASGSTGNKAYTANWTANTYSVVYNGNGNNSGSTDASTHTYDAAKALTANGFSRAYTVTYNHNYTGSTDTSANTAYVFAGWNTQENGSGTSYADNADVKNLTASGTFNLYAQWTPSAVKLETPSRIGYIFAGWYTDEACTQSEGAAGASYTPTESITLYAQWTANTYTVAYNGNGSTSGSTASSAHTYDAAQALTTNGFSRTYTVTYDHNYTGSTDTSAAASYTFAGWNTNANGSGTTYADNANVKNLAASGTFNLYAQWTPSAVTLDTPSRTGYIFAGWYTAATGGTKVGDGGASYTPTADVTLYAQWTVVPYTISYELDGGTNNASNPASYTITTAAISLGEPTRTGYTFAGWTGSNGTTAQQSVTIPSGSTGPKNYTAHWTANTYTVAYNGNGSTSGTTASSTHTYDAAQALTTNGFSRAYTVTYDHNYTGSTNTSANAAYTFAGWNTKADGSGTSYADKESVTNLAASGTFNLYAQWTSSAVKLETPSRTGYIFAGWYTETDSGTKAGDTDMAYTPTSSLTLYAHWTPISYKVHFDANGGAGSMTDETLAYDAASSLTANAFARVGYHFTGWSTTETGTVLYTDQQAVSNLIPDPNPDGTSSITLYAQWRIDPNTSETRTVIQEGITEVPEELTKIETLNTPAKIDAAMRIKITEAEKAIPTVNIEVHDVRLQFSTDDGKTWIDATKDNFPKEGITFTLPYPKGTNASNFNFVITHMFTTGTHAGETETLNYTKTADGLQVHVNSLSPFAVGYVKKADQPAGSPAAASQGKPDLWCITYLDCKGNTVSVQWVETGKAPIKPAGYSYPDISNVSAHQDVRPTSCRIDTKYVVPNTADKG